MRLLLLPPYFLPERMASTHLDNDRYIAFAEEGWEMSLYTPMPTRGVSDEIRQQYKNIRCEKLFDDKMTVRRFWMMKERNGVISRAVRYSLCFFMQLFYGLTAKNIDVVYLVSTPPIQGLLGAVIKRLRGIPFVYNLQDIFPDSMIGAGITRRNTLIWKIGRLIENYTYKHADKIIVISEDFKENLLAKGVPSDKIEVIYNWIDVDAVYPVEMEDNVLFDKFGMTRDDKFRIVYAGNFGRAQNIDAILDAAQSLKEYTDIQFLLFGVGETFNIYKDTAFDRELSNVVFLPLQGVEDVKYVYSMGDVGVVTCKSGIGKGAFPSKTWSIMAAGIPVLANYDSDTDLECIIRDNELGMFSCAGNNEDFVNSIIEMYKDRQKCKTYGNNARTYVVSNVAREVCVNSYVEVIRKVCGC